jgi:hypothetical protein
MSTHGELGGNARAGRLCKILMAGSLLVCVAALSNAAELKEETLEAWNEYIRAADSHMQERLQADKHFLWIDEAPDRGRQTAAGEILVSAVVPHNPRRVPSGLIHHWIGAAFIPNAKLDDVFAVVRDYSRYKQVYKPAVIDAKPVRQAGTHDTFSMLLLNKAVLKRTALESDYESSYYQLDAKRWYSVSSATRVQEIEDYGQPSERKLPLDEGGGYIWRLHSISRFEERDGGVYVELEAVALSRDIPVSLRWIVDPVVRRVSRDALLTSLRQTSNAVSSVSGVSNSTVKQAAGDAMNNDFGTKGPPHETPMVQSLQSGHLTRR